MELLLFLFLGFILGIFFGPLGFLIGLALILLYVSQT